MSVIGGGSFRHGPIAATQLHVVLLASTVQLDVVFRQACECRRDQRVRRAEARTDVPSPVMAETTDGLPEDWWTTENVLAYLRSAGAPISRVTWAAYVSRGQAPAADRMFGRSPAWRPAVIRDWQANRPRRGSLPIEPDTASSPPPVDSSSTEDKSTGKP